MVITKVSLSWSFLQVYALDARNHGNSDHVNQMDYHVMCKDVVRFCEDHQLEKTTVIGRYRLGIVSLHIIITALFQW